MNLLDAVVSVLSSARKPLSSEELTKSILDQGMWSTQGKTPSATVGARIYVDIKKHRENSRFQRVGKNLFALRSWEQAENITGKDISPEQQPSPLPRRDELPNPKSIRTDKAGLKRTLSFTDSAEQVLLQFGNKQPMHYREITKRALDLGLLQTQGETPEATLYAQVLTEISRKSRRGEAPRFVKHGRGFIGLSQWMGKGLAFQIEQQNATVRKKLRAKLYSMEPTEFEQLVGKLLAALGFEQIDVTRRSGDGGIDVRGILVVGDVIRTRMAVQVKKWKPNVQAPIVQQVRGSLGTHEQGLVITTSDFSSGARQEAERSNAVPVALMNGEQLVALLVENNIGVQRNSYDLFELKENLDE